MDRARFDISTCLFDALKETRYFTPSDRIARYSPAASFLTVRDIGKLSHKTLYPGKPSSKMNSSQYKWKQCPLKLNEFQESHNPAAPNSKGNDRMNIWMERTAGGSKQNQESPKYLSQTMTRSASSQRFGFDDGESRFDT
jgi:hypothetical protein